MWTGGHNEVIPYTLKSAAYICMLMPMILPLMYKNAKYRGKIKHNVANTYPDRRLDIHGNYTLH